MKKYILDLNKKLDIPAIKKEKQKRAEVEKKLGKMSDKNYWEYKKRFLK